MRLRPMAHVIKADGSVPSEMWLVFLFIPPKSLGACGDAGMIVTNNKDIYEKALMQRDYGRIGR